MASRKKVPNKKTTHREVLRFAGHLRVAGVAVLCLIGTVAFGQTTQKAAPDTDRDGIADAKDRCPNSVPGVLTRSPDGCALTIDPYADLKFDSAKHKSWYKRFWTGSCTELQGELCFEGKAGSLSAGSGFWSDLIEQLSKKAPAKDRNVLKDRLFKLGRTVGFEWARENDVRKIDTSDVGTWWKELTAAEAASLVSVANALDNKVAAKLK